MAKPRPKASSEPPTLYEVLDMPPGSEAVDLKERYRQLAIKHHPDKKGGDHDKFCGITEAGSILLDTDRRKVYDAKLRLTRVVCPKCDGDGRQFIQMGFTARQARRCPGCKGVGYV